MLIGAVADDITGATDLCLMLSRAGLRTVQVMGVPDGALPVADAVVIALKSRTIPAGEAVAMSLSAPLRVPCWQAERGRSCSNTARPSTAPMRATSAR